jgi:signal transduction histidine kinase
LAVSPAPAPAELASSAPMMEAREDEADFNAGFQRLTQAPTESKSKKGSANTLGKVKDLPIELNYQQNNGPLINEKQSAAFLPDAQLKRESRKEQSVITQSAEVLADERASTAQQVSLFESDVEPYGFSLLGSGHFVLYRQVWSQGQRYIQGALFDQQAFLHQHVVTAFKTTEISAIAHLVLAYQDDVLLNVQASRYQRYLDDASQLRGELLHRSTLLAPFENLEMLFTVSQLPVSETVSVINYTAVIYLIILGAGSLLLYRLGARQIRLGQQQQDFVSAVSHELKTPLTAIRMYGEILKAGWASEDKKKEYYDFIYDESERLSRLINNVLQLARFNKNELQATLKAHTVGELVDLINAKILYQCEAAGFTVALQADPELKDKEVMVDEDFFQQIIINLVDNAIKFSSKAERKELQIGVNGVSGDAGRVEFFVRDFGPGIPKSQLGKIFRLFYRVESELTRETVGTGIGLALVDQLARAMRAKVDVINCDRGAKFLLVFRVV